MVDGGRDNPRSALPRDASRRLDEIGRADVLVGIPAVESAETIAHVATAVEAGLRKHFGELDAVICISDGGSRDGTLHAALEAGVGDQTATLLVPPSTPVPRKVGFTYEGPPGKGSALRAIFEAAARLEVRACAVVDADLRSITPTWIDRLLTPIVHHSYEYVAPLYARHKYDGTITNSIAYPLTAALYGARLRQPIGGEFGLSGDLARAFASEQAWDTDVARFGVDIWMTTEALVRGARTCQAVLGAKLHDPRDPGKDLGPMFRQVVGTLFSLAGRHRQRWWEVDRVAEITTFGFPSDYAVEPIEVSLPLLTWKFVDGYVRHRDIWHQVLSEESLDGLEDAVRRASEDSRGLVLDRDLWFRVVYDFLAAHAAGTVDPGSLLDSLLPLFYGRTATVVEESRDDTDQEADARVEAGVDAAVALKPHLRARWPRVPAT